MQLDGFGILSVAEVEVYVDDGDINVALNQPAIQSSEFKVKMFPASFGVNGKTYDFTHTNGGGEEGKFKI